MLYINGNGNPVQHQYTKSDFNESLFERIIFKVLVNLRLSKRNTTEDSGKSIID